jgi:hypothetical protein
VAFPDACHSLSVGWPTLAQSQSLDQSFGSDEDASNNAGNWSKEIDTEKPVSWRSEERMPKDLMGYVEKPLIDVSKGNQKINRSCFWRF